MVRSLGIVNTVAYGSHYEYFSDKPAKARLTADDWKNAALKRIAEQGFSAVNVERLAKDMGVTKGSFYWHFSSRKELLKESLAHWEISDIATFERSIAIYKNPLDRLRALFRRTTRECILILFTARCWQQAITR